MGEESSKWFKIAIEASRRYGGKIMVLPKVPVRSLQDFSIWYTPGVAAVSREISADIDKSFEYTWRWNAIAVLTDGSRVLGLGNVGQRQQCQSWKASPSSLSTLVALMQCHYPLG